MSRRTWTISGAAAACRCLILSNGLTRPLARHCRRLFLRRRLNAPLAPLGPNPNVSGFERRGWPSPHRTAVRIGGERFLRVLNPLDARPSYGPAPHATPSVRLSQPSPAFAAADRGSGSQPQATRSARPHVPRFGPWLSRSPPGDVYALNQPSPEAQSLTACPRRRRLTLSLASFPATRRQRC